MMHIHQECFGLNGFRTPLRLGNSVFFNSVSAKETLPLEYVGPGPPPQINIHTHIHTIYIYMYTL